MTNTTTHHLYDADTGDIIGPATREQVDASDDAEARGGYGGVFLIDQDGDVIAEGSWDAQRPGVRRVYTQA